MTDALVANQERVVPNAVKMTWGRASKAATPSFQDGSASRPHLT